MRKIHNKSIVIGIIAAFVVLTGSITSAVDAQPSGSQLDAAAVNAYIYGPSDLFSENRRD
ncbi:MAG TPA: hypothetical protein VGF86_01025 [Candidatus Tumulicola sp.]|jgi:hypothetical protein